MLHLQLLLNRELLKHYQVLLLQQMTMFLQQMKKLKFVIKSKFVTVQTEVAHTMILMLHYIIRKVKTQLLIVTDIWLTLQHSLHLKKEVTHLIMKLMISMATKLVQLQMVDTNGKIFKIQQLQLQSFMMLLQKMKMEI